MSAQGSDAGERRLVSAVLVDAIRLAVIAARRPERRDAPAVVEACTWLASDDTLDPMSYRRICGYLDLDADRLRTTVLFHLRAIAAGRPSATRERRPTVFAPAFGEHDLAARPRIPGRRAVTERDRRLQRHVVRDDAERGMRDRERDVDPAVRPLRHAHPDAPRHVPEDGPGAAAVDGPPRRAVRVRAGKNEVHAELARRGTELDPDAVPRGLQVRGDGPE